MDPQKPGDLPVDPVVPPVETPTPPQEPEISRELYEKFKSDSKAFQDKLKATEAQLEDMKMAKLKATKNWEEIARLKEEEANFAKNESKSLRDAIIGQQKSIALRGAATKAGINPASLDDLDLLDLDEVTVETTSQGKIIVNGADAAVLRLKMMRPHWFTKTPSNVNPQSPEVRAPGSPLSLADLNKLNDAYKKNPRDAEAMKAYADGIKQFNSQKR